MRERHSRPPKKKPPQEATGRERQFLNAALKQGSRVTLQTRDGEEISGTIAEFSEPAIELVLDNGEQHRIQKSSLRWVNVVQRKESDDSE